jgi:membrane protein implicated in regulation of membrane protease activity
VDNYTFFLLVVAVLTVGAYLLLPHGYRHWAVLLPLLIVFVIVIWDLFRIWGFSFKLLFLILAGLLVVTARVWVGRRM